MATMNRLGWTYLNPGTWARGEWRLARTATAYSWSSWYLTGPGTTRWRAGTHLNDALHNANHYIDEGIEQADAQVVKRGQEAPAAEDGPGTWECPAHPFGHDWGAGLACRRCRATRTAAEAIVSALAGTQGWSREAAEAVRDAHRRETLGEVARMLEQDGLPMSAGLVRAQLELEDMDAGRA